MQLIAFRAVLVPQCLLLDRHIIYELSNLPFRHSGGLINARSALSSFGSIGSISLFTSHR